MSLSEPPVLRSAVGILLPASWIIGGSNEMVNAKNPTQGLEHGSIW